MDMKIGAFNSLELISNKTCYKGTGFTDDDLARPMIGIACSYNEAVPGHVNLRELCQQVKNGIYRAGGTPVEFGVMACCMRPRISLRREQTVSYSCVS